MSSIPKISVKIPTILQRVVNNAEYCLIEGTTVKEVLENLIKMFPALRQRLYDETGEIRKFINIYLNDEDIRFLDNLDTKLQQYDELNIVPAIAGG